MVAWHIFKARRRLKVKEWLQNRGIKTYEDLVDKLRPLGVDPPSADEAQEMLAELIPPVKSEVKKIVAKKVVELAKPPAKKPATTKPPAKKKAPAKKAAPKKAPAKKSTTRKTPTRRKKVEPDIPEVEIPTVDVPKVEV